MIAGFVRGRSATTRSDTKRRGRRLGNGQSLVEFAVVFPVFMLVLSGILDFGFMLYSRMSVISATREGARAAVAQADDVTVIPTLVRNAVWSAVSGTGLTLGNLQDPPTVSCVRTPSGTCNFNAKANAVSGDSVKVTVTYTYSSFFPLLFGSTFNLSSTVQMVIE